MHFDYIIVGGGIAGCVLANRLSEDPANKVLLIEAGSSETLTNCTPSAAHSKQNDENYHWAYQTSRQLNLDGRKLRWSLGKMMGGSSAISNMVYTRGHRSNFDYWNALGCKGWDYESVVPYFERAENFLKTSDQNRVQLNHSQVSPSQATKAFINACVELGFKRTNFNKKDLLGTGYFEVSHLRERRIDSAKAYLRPAVKRNNLTVLCNVTVIRVLIEKSRAVGVECLRNSDYLAAYANREVLLSSGAVNSPKLLMLSGVGPGAHLKKCGIEVICNSPCVGQNLQDHLLVANAYKADQHDYPLHTNRFKNFLSYLLVSNRLPDKIIWEAAVFSHSAIADLAPDLGIIFSPSIMLRPGFKSYDQNGLTLSVTLLQPKSRGSVMLASRHMRDAPIIDPNYLSQKSDFIPLLHGMKIARAIASSPALKPWRTHEVWPGNKLHTDEQIESFIRATAQTLHHPVGTCRMGSDVNAVVDSQLRVRGVTGLRVVDASIMPTITSAHTQAATYMIAEKAAAMIKAASRQSHNYP